VMYLTDRPIARSALDAQRADALDHTPNIPADVTSSDRRPSIARRDPGRMSSVRAHTSRRRKSGTAMGHDGRGQQTRLLPDARAIA
jgi:hypothetical protein